MASVPAPAPAADPGGGGAGSARPARLLISTGEATYQVDTNAPLGKGGFGTVYKALNLQTGDFVAIKQIRLLQIPQDQLAGIMSEIDLLKKLRHANIVKYLGYSRSKEYLNIVLEYMESGSLASLLKRFGQLPEALVGRYIGQVLTGLEFLHEQGVIHRDIKGANILTTKAGHVKLADFGVATKLQHGQQQQGEAEASSVVGTPYWMAPEVIEMSGATTKSDIWSVGATVIELLHGEPPYFDLPPMSALFRIVQDDHPPLPPALSAPVHDFLMQCFVKEPQMRVSASRLLRHPWPAACRKPDADAAASLAALEQPPPGAAGAEAAAAAEGEDGSGSEWGADFAEPERLHERVQGGLVLAAAPVAAAPWDVASTGGDSRSSSLQLSPAAAPGQHVQGQGRPQGLPAVPLRARDSSDDEAAYDSLGSFSEAATPPPARPAALTVASAAPSAAGAPAGQAKKGRARKQGSEERDEERLEQWKEEDGSDDDVFGELPAALPIRLRLRPAQGPAALPGRGGEPAAPASGESTDTEADPFEGVVLEEDRSEEKTLAGDVARRMDAVRAAAAAGVGAPGAEAAAAEGCEELARTLGAHAEQPRLYANAHGLLPLLDLLAALPDAPLLTRARLRLFGAFAADEHPALQETLCLVGAVPALLRLTGREQPKPVRVEAARCVRQLCLSRAPSVVEMVVACKGLTAMADCLAQDYADHKELVLLAVDALHRVFHLPSLHVPKTELGALLTLHHALPARIAEAVRWTAADAEGAEEHLARLLDLALLLSRSHAAAKRGLTALPTLKRLLGLLPRLSQEQCVKLLKAVKYLSGDGSTLAALQRAGAIRRCTELLAEQAGEVTDVSNQVLATLYNLLRIDRGRQDEAARAGLLPLLLPYAAPESTLKQFALPMLVDLAFVPAARPHLWAADMLDFYFALFADPYWQLPALEALCAWCADDEPAARQVAARAAWSGAVVALVAALPPASLPRALQALQRLPAGSPLVVALLPLVAAFVRLLGAAALPANDRIVLLKLLKTFFESAPSPSALLAQHQLRPAVAALTSDRAVFIQELAGQLLAQFDALRP